jgi:hypothetical protein
MATESRAWRRGRTWLLAAAVLVVPLAGVFLVMYGVGRLALKQRPKPAPDPYKEWLDLRDLMRSQRHQAQSVVPADPIRRRP